MYTIYTIFITKINNIINAMISSKTNSTILCIYIIKLLKYYCMTDHFRSESFFVLLSLNSSLRNTLHLITTAV